MLHDAISSCNLQRNGLRCKLQGRLYLLTPQVSCKFMQQRTMRTTIAKHEFMHRLQCAVRVAGTV